MKLIRLLTPLMALPACLMTPQAFATEYLDPPPGTDNLEFIFAPGTCQDIINITLSPAPGAGVNLVRDGCNGDVLSFHWSFTSGDYTGVILNGVVGRTSFDGMNRPHLDLVDAFWTSGPANNGSVWPSGGGARDYVVLLLPEPASWAMMLAGLALTGLALRRRSGRSDGQAQMPTGLPLR